MADTNTTNLNLVKPEVGASSDTWGTKINTNLDSIDGLFGTGPALLVSKGGTGASTASGARTALGLGSIATQAADAVAITGGAISGITDLAIADGGTGASTASGARTNLGLGALATLSAVGSSEITDGSVGTAELADNAVTSAKIAANSVDGTKIALGSDAQGDIMYYNGTDWVRLAAGTSGQLLKTNGTGANPEWHSPFSGGTAVATTSGSSFDFTGIPSWAKRITVICSGVSSSSDVQVRLGTSAGPETTGYSGGYSTIFGNDQNTSTSSSSGFAFPSGATGVMTIAKVSGSTWVSSHSGWYGSGSYVAGGSKTLSTGSPAGGLTQIQVRTSGTFSAGSVNIMYE